MATNTSDFFTFSKTAGTAKNLQKPTDGGDNNLWGGYINVDLDTIVGAVNATSDLIADANQNELVDFTATGSAVNHVGITNAATGNGPTIEAKGDDTNIDLNVSGKGTGKLATTSPKITTGINDSNNNELIKVTATGSAVNEITVANAATGNGPTLSATGDDTNIDLNISGKGSGTAKFTSNIIIPDAGNIGSVSDPDAIAIASDGGLTFNGGIDNSGTISAGTIGGGVSMASSGVTVRNIEQVSLGSDQTLSSSTAKTTFFSPTYNPKFSGSKVQGWFTMTISCEAAYSSSEDGRKDFDLEFTGSDITPITWGSGEINTIGSNGTTTSLSMTIIGPLITTNGTSTITCNCKIANQQNDASVYWYVYGDGTARETTMTWVEYK